MYKVRGNREPIANTHPWIIDKLVNKEDAYKYSKGSHVKVKFYCKICNQTWEQEVKTALRLKGQCPYCSGKKVCIGLNDLATTHPELIKELADPEDAKTVTYGSGKKLRWKCSVCGHIYQTTPNNKTNNRSGCPKCALEAKKRQLLVVARPDLAKELVDKTLLKTLTRGSHKKVEWQCELGHRWFSTVFNRSSHNSGCPFCSGNKVLPGLNSIADTHPHLASQLADKSLASKISAGSHTKVLWKCEKCGGTWFVTPNSRSSSDNGCPICANKKVVEGINSIADTHPHLADQLVDQSLRSKISSGHTKKVFWKCPKCGGVWETTPFMRSTGNQNCPYCVNQKVLVGFNDLWTTHPEIAQQLVGPSLGYKVVSGSSQMAEFVCEKGHVVEQKIYDRAGGHGCKVCSKAGISKMEKELYEYIVSLNCGEVVANDRSVLDGLEIDVYLPEKKIGIEFNGLFWHCHLNKPNKYHEEKFLAAEKKGVRLIQIFEDDWINRPEVVKNTLAHKLGCSGSVYARKTQVRQVDSKEARAFYDTYHMQGKTAATFSLGLYYEDDLVACMSFRKCKVGRTKRLETDIELVRFAAKMSVVGGASKLLAHAMPIIHEMGCNRIISFSDNCLSDGALYKTLGFELAAELAGDYKYFGVFTDFVRKPKESFQKRKFRDNPELLWEDGLTEFELADMNDLKRIYDAGKRRWEKLV